MSGWYYWSRWLWSLCCVHCDTDTTFSLLLGKLSCHVCCFCILFPSSQLPVNICTLWTDSFCSSDCGGFWWLLIFAIWASGKSAVFLMAVDSRWNILIIWDTRFMFFVIIKIKKSWKKMNFYTILPFSEMHQCLHKEQRRRLEIYFVKTS